MTVFTPESLPTAITGLFRLNGYEVRGPLMKYGGEVDLVATKESDLFADPVYIEATVEHVDNVKYAKDLTKLLAIKENEPKAKLLIISSTGFTPAVRTKATSTGIETWTFEELERRFQRFDPYLGLVFGDSADARSLRELLGIYEEPDFEDTTGYHAATDWLSRWLVDPDSHRWLIVTGEYGTGKTALTRILLYRWLEAYRTDATRPIPFRIELRAFTRQFDARSLLHHFLDQNGLGGLPIEFVFSLIRTGRVVLLLDGYDEMAQYMSARERRSCLQALAQLSADGARGILTSRPNYFSEAEELQVLDALYTSFEQIGRLTRDEADLVATEEEVDALFQQQIIERVERQLRDLTPEQTSDLVRRKLATDPQARDVVMGLLERIFRSSEEGTDIALSGKPVIITYLLDIADELKDEGQTEASPVSEWQVYDLIVRKLMMRDYRAAPETLPERRRLFLRRLAIRLSHKSFPVLSEEQFVDFVREDFAVELKRVPAETRESQLQQFVLDLRRSATLTRNVVGGSSGYRFSHNSLREFLATEALLDQLSSSRVPRNDVPISNAMRNFSASREPSRSARNAERLSVLWPNRGDDDGTGQILSLLWLSLLVQHADQPDVVRASLLSIVGPGLDLGRTALESLNLTAAGIVNLRNASFRGASLTKVSFAGVDLRGASFQSAILDEVDFAGADLSDTVFTDAAFSDVDFTDATVKKADFHGAEHQIEIRSGERRYDSAAAVGLLRSRGAQTADVDPVHVLRHHPKFDVATKVAGKLLDGAKHQVRGLTQRGSAQSDPRFAGRFLVLLLKAGFAAPSQGRQLVQITDLGRRHLGPFVDLTHLTPELEAVFREAL